MVRIESKLLSVWLAVFSTKNLGIKRRDDLKDYTVAYYRGRKNVEKDLSEHIQHGKSFDSIDDEETFKWLEAGRVEVVISESREGNRLISSDGRFSNIF